MDKPKELSQLFVCVFLHARVKQKKVHAIIVRVLERNLLLVAFKRSLMCVDFHDKTCPSILEKGQLTLAFASF